MPAINIYDDTERRILEITRDMGIRLGFEIGDYLINSAPWISFSEDGTTVELEFEAVDLSEENEAGYLTFVIPVRKLLDGRLSRSELMSSMFYDYDRELSDTYEYEGLWDDGSSRSTRSKPKTKATPKSKAKGRR